MHQFGFLIFDDAVTLAMFTIHETSAQLINLVFGRCEFLATAQALFSNFEDYWTQ